MIEDHHTPAPGSSAYYAIRFAPASTRNRLHALYAVAHAIASVPREVHDVHVAQSKLNWWQNELVRATQGQAQHPAVQDLALHLQSTHHFCWSALRAHTSAAQALLQQSRYLDEHALLQQTTDSAHPLADMVASILAPEHTLPPSAVRSTHVAAALVRTLQRTGADVRTGCLRIPISELQQFNIKAHEILNGPPALQTDERYLQLMAHQTLRARHHLDQARQTLHQQPRALRRFSAIVLAHHRDLLDAIEAQRYAVLHQHIRLTPLRKLWLGWIAR